jgi:ferredoxin
VISGRPDARIDERDTMFARAARRPGSRAYLEYYARHPERRTDDDRLRGMPPLLEPGGRAFDDAVSGEARAWFDRIDTWEPGREVTALADAFAASADLTALLKTTALSLGAVAAGCCGVDPMWAYSHKGRFDEDYARVVDARRRPHALVFLVEMDHAEMSRAPMAAAIRESARQYFRAAGIARTIERALLAAGIDAAAHYDAHYEVVLPPMAVAAGLGELGRHNILVADRFGTRVRIGAVTMTAALRADRPRDLGVQAFCTRCRKCADNCPPRALSPDAPVVVNGVEKWPTDAERCYRYWRLMGTDCGICMAVCPFSHPDNAFHNVVRRLVRALPALAPAFVRADDVVYGRVWRGTRSESRS